MKVSRGRYYQTIPYLVFLLLLSSYCLVIPSAEAQNRELQGVNSFAPSLLSFNENTDITLDNPDKRVLLANSVENYPVTPGDVYQLVYIGTSRLYTLEAMVNGDFTLNLHIFGTIKVNALTYSQLREKVTQLVLRAYPQSKPHLALRSTGIFQVYLKGEAGTSGFISCWGLSRLSEVVQNRTTPWSSLRRVEVITSDGTFRFYDLFAALHFGKQEEDPYVQPGMTVVLHKYERQVKVSGEVFRPGTYQLLKGEGLAELITLYANGFTPLSYTRRIELLRSHPDQSTAGEKSGLMYYLDAASTAYTGFTLQDGDEIFIPSSKEKLPVVYFEGAISGTESAQSKIPVNDTTEKIIYTFTWGEKLSTALRALKTRLATTAHLSAAYLLREGETASLPVDLVKLLHDYTPEQDIELRPYDRIIIPYKEYWVTVTGAVAKPGLYPYQPERSYLYYLDLAGGALREKNLANAVKITDRLAKKQSATRLIQPEDTIYVYANHPLYHVGQWATLIGAAISVTTLVVSLIQLSQNP